jgi:UDP-N-acetylglucosamine--N-acetylmuramyl-(pentapeptide) pyrophosphoryl-undecaprenol N-acetylglucosamine transferase
MSGPRIVIAAGGTAGHVVPAIAVADALRAEGAEVSFVGGQRAEAELVPAAGYPLDTIKVEGIDRRNPLKAARAALRAAAALRTAGRILRDRRAAAVLGGGGYVAGPVGLAAVLRRVPLVLTEADSHLGLTNRLLAARARRVCLAFPLEGRTGERYLVTGRPVPARTATREEARAALGIGPDERCVLVFGGSLGARSVNHAAVEAFADAPYRVLHVAGRRDFPDLRAPGPHYDLRDYLSPFGQALAAADLAVARAGGSIFELAQYGLPAVLIPYPHATADHQPANARWMEQGGAAVVLPDATLTPGALRTAVDAILLDPERLAAMAAAAGRLARPDAAAAVANEVLAAVKSSIR